MPAGYGTSQAADARGGSSHGREGRSAAPVTLLRLLVEHLLAQRAVPPVLGVPLPVLPHALHVVSIHLLQCNCPLMDVTSWVAAHIQVKESKLPVQKVMLLNMD